MATSEPAPWEFGVRPKHELLPAFELEFAQLAAYAENDSPRRDGRPSVERALFQADLVKLMKRAHNGTVRDLEYDVVSFGDVVAELKHPRPGHQDGWHYRLYTGVPLDQWSDHLVWSLAGRKQDSRIDKLWKRRQNEHIDTAIRRFKGWIISRSEL